jgi:ATP-dependent RNA helicase SUPV3L1/SUV3
LYGNLSPGVRREEARRFRAGETDILIATDCIGMGLNLPIKTVIFSETHKFDGKDVRALSVQELKQIGGRAGRFGKFECGYVGVRNGSSVKALHRSIHIQQESKMESCYVRPTLTQLEVLREQIGNNSIKSAISLFSQLSPAKSMIVCSDLDEMLKIADRIENLPQLAAMSFSDKHLFTCAPVSVTDVVMDEFIRWLSLYTQSVEVELRETDYSFYLQNKSTSEDLVLNQAENSVKVLTVYHWLARKKPDFFPDFDLCEELREKINAFIENSLKRKGLHKKCPYCSKKLPLQHPHRVCDACFRSNRSNW